MNEARALGERPAIATWAGFLLMCVGMFMANSIPGILGMIVVQALWGLLVGVMLATERQAS